MSTRVRFAPSPTGPLHIGGVRTALYNYLFAKKHKGAFILRVEDTDQNRYVEGAEAYITKTLDWLGINPDESPNNPGAFGPYRQSERKESYLQHAQQLVKTGNAYLAFDTTDTLQGLRETAEQEGGRFIYNWENRNALKNCLSLSPAEVDALIESNTPYVIRFKSYSGEQEKTLHMTDKIRGEVNVDASLLDDKIIVKQDGMPTYHLANVVDDHFMEISHVIRGEEWLPSMALHVLLYEAFGWKAPVFAHVPLILKPTGKGKLSKRDGEKFGFPVFPLEWNDDTKGFKEAGYLPEALVNYLALLGWNPGGEEELFSLEELVSLFSLEGITKAGGRFDPERCKWFNQQHLHKVDSRVVELSLDALLQERGISPTQESTAAVVALVQDRLTLLTDLWDEAHFFFVAPVQYDEKAIRKQWKEETPEILTAVKTIIERVSNTQPETLSAQIKSWAHENGLKLGMIMAPLRIALVGALKGPDVFAICSALGRAECMRRIAAAIEKN
ncbi:glutamate--tRNA ligase [Flavobacteriaceae bacterium]|nr:glutamate--tRNA ligase [Flavobacteriaceae bacterium]